MRSFFIGIAGGSGAGKTALAKELKKHFKQKASVFHLDNYQKFGEKLPLAAGLKNWDHPNSIKWDKLRKDLISLKRGHKIVVETRNQKLLSNLELPKEVVFSPSKVVIIEGNLLFCRSCIRRLLDFLIYLEAGDRLRMRRRTKFKDPQYAKGVLLPMYRQYVEPTKKFADLVLDTGKHSLKKCCQQAARYITPLAKKL